MPASVNGIEFTGLRETIKALGKLGVSDDAVKDAMQDAGNLVAREAWRVMPVDSGRMARTLKVNRSKTNLTITVGNNTTVQYAYNFHAKALGTSKGGYTFRVPAYRRKTGNVAGYTAQRWLPRHGDFPFMFIAWERKQADLYRAWVTAMDKLFRSVDDG